MNVVASLVKAPIGVPTIIGQLMVKILDPFLCVQGHAFGRIALGVNACEDRSEGLPNREGTERLGRNQNDFPGLPLLLTIDQFLDDWIDLLQGLPENQIAINHVRHFETPRLGLLGHLFKSGRGSAHRESRLFRKTFRGYSTHASSVSPLPGIVRDIFHVRP